MAGVTLTRPRSICVLSGLAAIGTILLGLVYWREIAIAYQVFRLRSDPRALVEILPQSENPILRVAVERFLRSEDGKRALVGTYIEIVRSWFETRHRKNPFPGMKTGFLALLGSSVHWSSEGPVVNGMGSIETIERIEILERINRFLPLLSHQEVVLEDSPQWVVSVLPMVEVTEQTGRLVRTSASSAIEEAAITLLIEDLSVRLDAPQRILGKWVDSAGPARMEGLEFLEEGRAKVTRNGEEAAGQYSLENDRLTLRIDGGAEEVLHFSFSGADELIVDVGSPSAKSGFLRRCDAELMRQHAQR